MDVEVRKINWKAKGKKDFYDCFVLVDDDKKLILKISCQCWNFLNRRIKSFGSGAYKKIYSFPCKHLKKITDSFIKLGYIFKIPNMIGTDKCTSELRKFLIERSGGICERNRCENNIEEIHRITPGTHGGKYNKTNCLYICSECHKLIPTK